jgi:hypothetical protein
MNAYQLQSPALDHIGESRQQAIAAGKATAVRSVHEAGSRTRRGEASAGADIIRARGQLSFWRIVDVPFETCVAAFDSWQHTGPGSQFRFGASLLHGPVERDRDTGTYRIHVRLAWGPLRRSLRMRLDIDRWSATSTAVELIPCALVRPTTAYFTAGHLFLDSLTRFLSRLVLPATGIPDWARQ